MQEFLRHNFWVLHLVSIAIQAYLFSGLAGELIGVAFLSPPKVEGNKVNKTKNGAIVDATKPIKPESKVSLLSILQDHNPFDAEPKVEQEVEQETDAKPELQLADIGVDLLGILVSSKPEWSLAIIKFQNNTKLVRQGVVLGDVVEVAEIASRYIVLQVGDKKKVVKLWAEKGMGQKPISGFTASSPRPPISVEPSPASSSQGYAKGVKKLGAYDYQIDRGMLEENLADLTKLGMEARIVPNYVDGKYQGFRLVGIRPDSLFRAIGLESGDLIKRINGREIDTPNKAIELFEQLKNSSNITLDIDRRGQQVQMNYVIK